MSIYKFMAGFVVDLTEGGSSDFDPHQYRQIAHPTSYLDTMTHLLKGSIGAGILAMPRATMRLGIVYATILLVAVGGFATYCIHLLIGIQYLLCKRHRRGYMAYPKSMLFAINDGPSWFQWTGKIFYWFVDITLIIWQLGICTIFLVFVSENMIQILGVHGYKDIGVREMICYLLPPTILLNLIKNLKMLSPLSTASNLITFLGLLLVTFYLIAEDLNVTPDKYQMKSWTEIPNFIGTALFALEAVGVVLALEYNMENPKDFGGPCGLFNIGMAIIVTMYALVGAFGYLKYGDKIEDSITLNLPIEEKKAQAAKLFIAFAIFLSFPLQNFVAYSIIWRRLKKRFTEETKTECLADYILRVALVVFPCMLQLGAV